ncbi:hypothetical protein [Microbacterium sp.]|uniref:hypothetical protein n=1 Tax=Microbacterium sp. TaxID=51671 RepID=UPI003F9D40EB
MSSDELEPTGASGSGGESWNEPDDASPDLTGMNMFTEEIQNVDASDWDVDSNSLWGDEGTDIVADIGGGPFDIDFPG